MITVSMLAKLRRVHFRDGVSILKIFRRTGLSRNTVRQWLREPKEDVPRYPKRVVAAFPIGTEYMRIPLCLDRGRQGAVGIHREFSKSMLR